MAPPPAVQGDGTRLTPGPSPTFGEGRKGGPHPGPLPWGEGDIPV